MGKVGKVLTRVGITGPLMVAEIAVLTTDIAVTTTHGAAQAVQMAEGAASAVESTRKMQSLLMQTTRMAESANDAAKLTIKSSDAIAQAGADVSRAADQVVDVLESNILPRMQEATNTINSKIPYKKLQVDDVEDILEAFSAKKGLEKFSLKAMIGTFVNFFTTRYRKLLSGKTHSTAKADKVRLLSDMDDIADVADDEVLRDLIQDSVQFLNSYRL